jgi:hypothetical protein
VTVDREARESPSASVACKRTSSIPVRIQVKQPETTEGIRLHDSMFPCSRSPPYQSLRITIETVRKICGRCRELAVHFRL